MKEKEVLGSWFVVLGLKTKSEERRTKNEEPPFRRTKNQEPRTFLTKNIFMHYLIFIPNKFASNRQNLIDAGLGDLVREGDEMPACADLVGPGPGGLPGQVWTWGDGIPAYLPDRQTWTADKLGRYWLGVQTDSPPTPADLLRREPVEGLRHVMADGREWMVPSVWNLPAVFALDDKAELTKLPHKRYAAFVDEADWALNCVIDALQNETIPDWKRAFEFCVMALSINYRINVAIAVDLGILDEKMLPTVMAKATDVVRVQHIIDDLKKKAIASPMTG